MSKATAMLVVEFVGTFLLTGAVLMGANPAIAFGILVLLIGGISGAHMNPAVSGAMASINKIKTETMVKFWVVQVAGALVARLVYEYSKNMDLSLIMNFQSLNARDVVIEIIGTAVFLLGITLAIGQKLDGIRLAVAIGGSLFLGALFGALLNPAIAFGFENVSLSSIVGPLIGGLIGIQIGQMVLDKKLK
jgi:glycerol uptake facilitator-like aquaporin